MNTLSQKKMLSISRMRTLILCPAKYFMKYEMGISVATTPSLYLGKVLHSCAEFVMKAKIDTKADMDLKKVLEVYDSNFSQMQKNEEVDFGEEDPGELKDDGIRLIEVYMKEVCNRIDPIEVESKFVIDFPDQSFGFTGLIDVIDRNGMIRDLKSSRKSYSPDVIDEDFQLTGYSLAYRYLHGNKNPAGVAFDVLVRCKNPKSQLLTSGPRSEQQLNRFMKTMKAVSNTIDSANWYPCEQKIYCGSCSYAEHCKKYF